MKRSPWPRFNTKISYQHRKSHCVDKVVLSPHWDFRYWRDDNFILNHGPVLRAIALQTLTLDVCVVKYCLMRAFLKANDIVSILQYDSISLQNPNDIVSILQYDSISLQNPNDIVSILQYDSISLQNPNDIVSILQYDSISLQNPN